MIVDKFLESYNDGRLRAKIKEIENRPALV